LRAQSPALRAKMGETDAAATAIHEENAKLRDSLQRQQAQTSDLLRTVRQIQSQRRALNDSGALVLLPGEGSTKRPIIVDCASSQVQALALSADGSTTLLGQWSDTDALNGIMALAMRLDSERDYFGLFIRPDAVKLHEELIDELRRRGFDVGWDAVPQNTALSREER
jgi:hypothetical protein